MRTSKVLFASILTMIFSSSAHPQSSTAETLRRSSTLQLQSGQPKPANIRVTLPVAAQARLLSVRISAEESSSRVVLATTALVHYSVGRLSNPDRLYVHLLEAAIDPQLKIRQIAVQDPLVSDIRIGNYEDSVTRVVFDLKSPTNYQISELPGGSGVIIELTTTAERRTVGPSIRATTTQLETRPVGGAPSEEQSLSAAISNPEVSIPSDAPNTQRTLSTTPPAPAPHMKGDRADIRDAVGLSVPVAVVAGATSIWQSDPKRSDAPGKLDSSTSKGIQRTVNKRSVVALGSFPPVSDRPLMTVVAVSEARSPAGLGEVDFPAATNEVTNTTRNVQTEADRLESHS